MAVVVLVAAGWGGVCGGGGACGGGDGVVGVDPWYTIEVSLFV